MSDNPFAERFPDLRPGKKPSGLGSVNGFGTRLVGDRDRDPETGTYVVTHVVTALFVPLVALAAYRVARAEHGGWYCLGRVPLSRLARNCNRLLVLALLGVAGGVGWVQYTKSPDYLAGQKLGEADRAAAAGQAAHAARLYREVMVGPTTRGDDARARLAGLIERPTGQPAEAAGVYAVAVDLHRENRCPVPDLFETGKAIAGRYAADDPAAALALLEVIAPYAPDPAAELALRRELLEKLLDKSPDDPAVASRLGAVYDAQGDRDRCEKVLAPFGGRLGTLDGAALLGRIYAGRGRLDKAHDLLAPYVAARLPALRTAQQDSAAQMKAAQDRVFNLLDSGKAPGFDYDRYKRSAKDQQKEMIGEYVSAQFKADPALKTARENLTAQRAVAGAALDLGLVQLQRGQARTDPAARKAELEAAEKTFLSVSTIAGEADEYRLSLGQVYYWLGRPADGRKLFDEMLAANGNRTEARLMVAHHLREVGDHAAARKLAEDAYAQAAGDQKFRAARVRALLLTDLDDEILWLGRCDPSAPDVRASLATSRGQKAEREGKDDEAADQFRRALDVYATLPENSATFNNAALAHLALYGVTHDREELARGLDKLDRSIALSPSSTITLANAAGVSLQAAAGDVIGAAVNFRALKAQPGVEVLAYLYRTPAERAAVAARLAAHPGVVRARSYAEKLVVLAPQRDESYQLLAAVAEYTRDVEGLTAVAARAEAARLDLADDERVYREYLSGASDAKKGEEARAAVARATAALAAARPVGGRTFAVAVGRYVRAKTGAWAVGEPLDADELVKLADEAHAAAPSAGTESTLETALLVRAHLTLAGEDAGYASLAKKTHRSLGVSLVHYALAAETPSTSRAAANPDVRRLAALALESFDRDPDGATAGEWVLVRAANPDRAAAYGAKARANPRRAARSRLSRVLQPYHASTAVDEYLTLVLAGKPAEAGKVLADLGARGVPVP